MTNEQILDCIPTVELVMALIKRDGVAANCCESENTSFIVIAESKKYNTGVSRICADRWTELNED